MAKPIVVSIDGIESSFDHIKLDRKRLYGERRRVPLDLTGEPCVKSALTSDGLYLLQSGMTAQGYFDESGRWLQKSQLVGIGSDGQALELVSANDSSQNQRLSGERSGLRPQSAGCRP